MKPGIVLLAVIAPVWLVLVATAHGDRSPASSRSSLASFDLTSLASLSKAAGSGAPDDYLGSASCRRCHEADYEQWEQSLHVRMTKPVAEAHVVGNFADGTRFADHGRSYSFGRKNGKPFISVASGGQAPETFGVDYTLGAKRYQGYLSTLPDGRIYVLPVFWHLESRRWIDWQEITPIPDGAHDLRQVWNANCFNCHGTNIVQGYDVAANRYNSSWTELGIGCEACHGGGREHVALMEEWERNPASKPAFDSSPQNPALTDILKVLSPRSATPRRTYDTCAYCHGNKTNFFVGFGAGDRFEDFALPFLLSGDIPVHDQQGEFWPDGRPNRFNRPQALTLSGCFQAGAITCTNCHVGHGSPNEHSLKWNIYQGRNGDNVCTQCHTAPAFAGAALTGHTFHAPESTGSRCVNCHMSDVNWRLLTRRRDHTFRPPTPETTARFGVPNACTTCHDEKTPEWAALQMDAWWGDGDRRRASLATADVMYRAGSGDVTVIPDLARLAVNRQQGAVLRASAADYVRRLLIGGERGRLQQSQTAFGADVSGGVSRSQQPAQRITASPAVVNALLGAASDPEAMVRATAVQALAATEERPRVLPALTARLVDTSRVVRARAAEALLALGVVVLPGAPGEALARAQDDYLQSLRSFPDVASNHAAIGWLEAERGRTESALRALDDALRIEPRYARPYVIKGIIAARAGRYQDAIGIWKKASELSPGDPVIKQLIAAAEKQKAGAP
jgi:predicted CXXCH cytochrome family protein